MPHAASTTHPIRPRLAAAAVSALAATGLAVAVAPAARADSTSIVLLSQRAGSASLGYDGHDSLVRLAARVTGLGAIHFEVNADPNATAGSEGWTAIGGAAVSDGYATLDWDGSVDGQSLLDTTFALRAESDAEDLGSDVMQVALDSSNAANIPSTPARYFLQPYADSGHTAPILSMSGTTDFFPNNVHVSWWDDTTQQFQGDVVSSNYPDFLGKVGRFDAALELTGFDAHDGATVAVRAQMPSGNDHVQPITMHPQTLGSIAVFSQNTGTRNGYDVTLVVDDTDGAPVAGAEVRRASDGDVLGYTDVNGHVTGIQTQPTDTYYANSTDTDAFEPAIDPHTDVSYVPEAGSTQGVLADGTVFDDDEYTPGDVAVQVIDQYGNVFHGATDVQYQLVAPGGAEDPDGWTTATSDADGRVTVPFDTSVADGTWTLESRIPQPVVDRSASTSRSTTGSAATAAPAWPTKAPAKRTAPSSPQRRAPGDVDSVEFLTGQATLTLSPSDDPVTAPSGDEVAYVATLAIGDKPLPGRDLDIAYTRGKEYAPGSVADAGIETENGVALSYSISTQSDGTAQFHVSDPFEDGEPAEVGHIDVTAGSTGAGADSDIVFGTIPDNPNPGPGPSKVNVSLFGQGLGFQGHGYYDILRVAAPATAHGQTVAIYRYRKGVRHLLWTVRLDGKGHRNRIAVPDTNGDKRTAYQAVLLPTAKFLRSASSRLRLH